MFLNVLAKVYNVLKNEKGQGMVEYGLILALVAIAAIAILQSLGGEVANKFDEVNTTLQGANP